MPPRRQIAPCQICNDAPFKYTCADCQVIFYCSVACYKEHKKSSCTPRDISDGTKAPATRVEDSDRSEQIGSEQDEPPLAEPIKLRALTTLKWPNVEPAPAIPDPLTANDPKPLQMAHYEAIATSSQIRALLNEDPQLPGILKALDKLNGNERERAFERILGVSADMAHRSAAPGSSGSHLHHLSRAAGLFWVPEGTTEEDLETTRAFMQTLSSVMLTAEQDTNDRQSNPVALEPAESK